MTSSSTGPFVLNTTPGSELSALESLRSEFEWPGIASADAKLFSLETQQFGFADPYSLSSLSESTRELVAASAEEATFFSSALELSTSCVRPTYFKVLAVPISSAFALSQTAFQSFESIIVNIASSVRPYLVEAHGVPVYTPVPWPLLAFQQLTGYASGLDDKYLEILKLQAVYSFRDHSAVSTFLRENFFLIDLLAETVEKVRNHFGASARLALEMFRDPNDLTASELIVRIRTSFIPAFARQVLNQFDEEWWIEASARSRCKMNIVLEYS